MEVDILLPAPVRSILTPLHHQGQSPYSVGRSLRDRQQGLPAFSPPGSRWGIPPWRGAAAGGTA